ncbi:MAG: XRE family transcriptional regulator [Paludibacteraceae bacterium]|nr:XRE family transcriptional regulator [Paludibacteraceae bacterium]
MEKEIHIGQLIHDKLHEQGRRVSWLATQICCERTNVYIIFKRKSIDTELRLKISKTLGYNFFLGYAKRL